jgi:hypothetical protein
MMLTLLVLLALVVPHHGRQVRVESSSPQALTFAATCLMAISDIVTSSASTSPTTAVVATAPAAAVPSTPLKPGAGTGAAAAGAAAAASGTPFVPRGGKAGPPPSTLVSYGSPIEALLKLSESADVLLEQMRVLTHVFCRPSRLGGGGPADRLLACLVSRLFDVGRVSQSLTTLAGDGSGGLLRIKSEATLQQQQQQQQQQVAGKPGMISAWRADSPFRWMDVLARLDSLDPTLCQAPVYKEGGGGAANVSLFRCETCFGEPGSLGEEDEDAAAPDAAVAAPVSVPPTSASAAGTLQRHVLFVVPPAVLVNFLFFLVFLWSA